MKLWSTLVARLVAQYLTSEPRLSVEEAVKRAQEQLLHWGLGKERSEEFVREYEKLGPVFHHKGVLNPQYLEEQLGKKTFLHMIDAREGRYSPLRKFMENWAGEHSRFILLGPEDALIVLYGTPEDEHAWTRYVMTEQGWPVDNLTVVKTSLLKGHPVRPPSAEQVSNIPVDDINKLVEEYWASNLEETRSQLEKANVLLGPTVLEDFSKTERVRAFVASRIGGHLPQSQEVFERALRRIPTLKQHIRSIYHCLGRYQLIVEIVCSSIRELDQVTEFFQRPEGATYSVETTTYVVANTELETMPTLSLETRAPWEGQVYASGPLVRRILAEEIIPRGATLARRFAELPDEERLFLVQALDDLRRIPLSSVEPEWEKRISHAKNQFSAGVVERSTPNLKGSITSLAPTVEAAGKRALRLTVEMLYLRDYGSAQAALKLPSADFRQYTLGSLLSAFRNISKDSYYQKIGIVFPRDFLRKMEYFKDLRNEFMHEEPTAGVEDRGRLAREVRDGLICGLEAISWLGTHIFARKALPLSSVPILLELARSDAAEGILAKVSRDVQTSSVQIQDLAARLDGLEVRRKSDVERLMRELAALSAIGSASTSQEKLWRQRLALILQKEDEILSHVKKPAQTNVQKLMTELREAGASLSLNLLANAIWFMLIEVSPTYLPTLLSWILGR